jgi:hypothetical protein
VDMVGHEAISDECHSVEVYVLPQQLKLDPSIGIAIQDEAPPVPTLRHMVWDINGNHTSESSHDRKRYQESFLDAAPDPHNRLDSAAIFRRTLHKDEKALIFY